MKAEIDWGKPIEASFERELGVWFPARVLCSLKGGGCAIAVDYGKIEGVVAVNSGGTSLTAIVRNVPPAPTPFEFTRWVNVYRDDINRGDLIYKSEEDASLLGRLRNREFVTVPVTIRGEWKEDGNG